MKEEVVGGVSNYSVINTVMILTNIQQNFRGILHVVLRTNHFLPVPTTCILILQDLKLWMTDGLINVCCRDIRTAGFSVGVLAVG